MDEMIQGRPQGTSFVDFTEYEKAFDQEVDRVELGFVRIGYMLRYALDTDILQGSGYTSMEEFAYAKYKIDKSQASRFIGINRRFSEGGYSDRLKEQFQGYGVAKLGELLTLPDEIIEVLPEELSRSAIQTVKKGIREEEKISDLEVMMEEPKGSGGSLLDQWMEVYFREHPDKYLQIRNLYLSTDRERMTADILAPSGTAAETARIPGTGKIILAIKGSDQNPILMNVRTMEKESYSWTVWKPCGGCALIRWNPNRPMNSTMGSRFRKKHRIRNPKRNRSPQKRKRLRPNHRNLKNRQLHRYNRRKNWKRLPQNQLRRKSPKSVRWNWRNTRELFRKAVLYAMTGRKWCSLRKHSGQRESGWRMSWPSGCVQELFLMQGRQRGLRCVWQRL